MLLHIASEQRELLDLHQRREELQHFLLFPQVVVGREQLVLLVELGAQVPLLMVGMAVVETRILGNQLPVAVAVEVPAAHLEMALMADLDMLAVYQETLAAVAAVETVAVARVKVEVRLPREAIIFLVSEGVADLP
jgi:hypothetical protein